MRVKRYVPLFKENVDRNQLKQIVKNTPIDDSISDELTNQIGDMIDLIKSDPSVYRSIFDRSMSVSIKKAQETLGVLSDGNLAVNDVKNLFDRNPSPFKDKGSFYEVSITMNGIEFIGAIMSHVESAYKEFGYKGRGIAYVLPPNLARKVEEFRDQTEWDKRGSTAAMNMNFTKATKYLLPFFTNDFFIASSKDFQFSYPKEPIKVSVKFSSPKKFKSKIIRGHTIIEAETFSKVEVTFNFPK
jgi:hypothetical protein